MQAIDNLLLHYETYVIPFQRGIKAVEFDVVKCRFNIDQIVKDQITQTRTNLKVLRDSVEAAVRFFLYRNNVNILELCV